VSFDLLIRKLPLAVGIGDKILELLCLYLYFLSDNVALTLHSYVIGDNRERRVIFDLLRGIESDLGWATDYRVKQLLKGWRWDQAGT
jgi:hypothetical protein